MSDINRNQPRDLEGSFLSPKHVYLQFGSLMVRVTEPNGHPLKSENEALLHRKIQRLNRRRDFASAAAKA
jgi:hypothetical protein